MTVEVHLYTQSAPVRIDNVRNAYQKGSMYCVMQEDGVVQKFPLEHIFRAKEYPSPDGGCDGCGGGCCGDREEG